MKPLRLLLALMVLAGSNRVAATVSATDDTGQRITLTAPAQRIVSLAPHTTELLFAAGAGDRVVGVSSYSDFPPAARSLPKVGSGGQANLEAILALKPDLVVAWKSGGTDVQLQPLKAFDIPVFFSEPRQPEDIADNLVSLGLLAGTGAAAEAAADALRAGFRRLGEQYTGRRPVRTFYQIWDRPLITVGGRQLINQVIRLCGGANIFDGLQALAPVVDREAVLVADPEVIIAGGSAGDRRDWLASWNAWPRISAVRHHQLYVIEPDLIQRPTPRLLQGARTLCEYLQQARAINTP